MDWIFFWGKNINPCLYIRGISITSGEERRLLFLENLTISSTEMRQNRRARVEATTTPGKYRISEM